MVLILELNNSHLSQRTIVSYPRRPDFLRTVPIFSFFLLDFPCVSKSFMLDAKYPSIQIYRNNSYFSVYKKNIHISLLCPLLMYTCPVWIGVLQQKLKRIQSFQNKILQISTNVSWSFCNMQLPREIGLLTTFIRSQAHRFSAFLEQSTDLLERNHLNHSEPKATFYNNCY